MTDVMWADGSNNSGLNRLPSPADARSVATVPSDYNACLKFAGFKQCSTLGVPTGTYCSIVGIHAWGDFSGDIAHELAFTDNGHVYHRSSTSSTAWGAWGLISGT